MEKTNEANVDRWVDDRLATLIPPAAWAPDTSVGLARFKSARNARRAWRTRWIWAAACTAAIGVCTLAFPVTRVFAQRCVSACASKTSLVCQLLWNRLSASNRVPGGVIAISDRTTAPDFTLPDASGKPVRLSDFRGQVVLLNFWATWCSPCRTEIPWFVEFQQTYRDVGFAVLGVSLDQDGWNSVSSYVEEEKVNYRVMVGDDEMARKYSGVESLPTTVLIDKAGRVAVRHVGLVEKKTYEEDLKALIAEH